MKKPPVLIAINREKTESDSPPLKCLIIDNDQRFISDLSTFLIANGHEVFEADCASAGLELLNAKHIDVLFFDFNLPNNKGLDFLSEIKEGYSLTEIVMVFSDHNIKRVMQALGKGALDYLEKPLRDLNLQVVHERIEKFMRMRDKVQRIEDINTFFTNNLGGSATNPVF